MIAFAELPEGVAVLRVYAKKGALTGACLVECHHAEALRRQDVCSLCRTKHPARPVKLLARIPPAALKGVPHGQNRRPAQTALF